MKTGLFSIACCSLLVAASAKYHGSPYHRHLHPKRDVEVVNQVVTNVQHVGYDASEVVVYVDAQGNPVSTETFYQGVAQTSTSLVSSSAATAAASPVAPVAENKQVVPSPAQAVQPASSSSASSSSDSGSSGSGISGITYTPYNADNSCKSTSQVAQDLSQVKGYSVIRLYGVDCNQVANVVAATKGKSVRLFIGIFDINSISDAVSTIKSGVNGDWSLVATVSVGNELVNSGKASVDQVTAAIGTARSALQGAGYSGPVVTVDTMIAMKNNPQLCQASDYCAINCHAFFDGNVLPADAGKFVLGWVQQVSQAAGGKRTVVTESGWPSQGGSNGVAVAGQQQQQQAISSLKSAFTSDLVLYTAFNDLWKQDNPSTHGCEKYWGIMGNAPS